MSSHQSSSITIDWTRQLERLEKLAGVDDGLFYLGVHSLVEAWVNELTDGEYATSFYNFGHRVDAALRDRPQEAFAPVLRDFKSTYRKTNGVRHNFDQLSPADARNSAEKLIILLRKADLGAPDALARLEKHLDQWPSYDPRSLYQDLNFLRHRLFQKEQGEKALQARVVALEAMEGRQAAMEEDLARRELEIKELERLRERTEKDRQRIETLRREAFQVREELRTTRRSLEDQEDALHYLDQLRTMHRTSRTRREYEQTLMRLSEEQESALKWFKPGAHYLVRGGAGTGKTLVLMAAVRHIRHLEAAELGLSRPRNIALVTYTRTLSNWSRQLLDLLVPGHDIHDVGTVDKAINEWAKELVGHRTIEYRADEVLRTLGNPCPPEVWKELEDFVWARGLDRAAYVEQATPRHGMKKPLPAAQRSQVWDQGLSLLDLMDHKDIFTKHAHRAWLLRRLQTDPPSVPLQRHDVLAVDEVQDLPPVELALLRLMAGSLIMAGDPSQSIYQKGFKLKDAGIDIVNRSRILTANFRNTVPLACLAQRFAERCPAPVEEATASQARRDGLPPRLMVYHQNYQQALLETIDYYTKVLTYEPRSLAIIAPEHNVVDSLETLLRKHGMESLRIRNDVTDLLHPEGIRLSTIHSAKGLDFPVVIALFPSIPGDRDLVDEERYRHQASLVYVAITRALENLTVLVPDTTNSTILKALVASFDEA